MNPCQELKQHLLEHGHFNSQAYPELEKHVQSCPHCKALLSAYKQIDEMLDDLPETMPPAKLIKQTQALISEQSAYPKTGHRKLAGGLATAAVLLAAIGLSGQLFNAYEPGFLSDTVETASISPPLPESEPVVTQSNRDSGASVNDQYADATLRSDIASRQHRSTPEKSKRSGRIAALKEETAELDQITVSGTRSDLSNIEAEDEYLDQDQIVDEIVALEEIIVTATEPVYGDAESPQPTDTYKLADTAYNEPESAPAEGMATLPVPTDERNRSLLKREAKKQNEAALSEFRQEQPLADQSLGRNQDHNKQHNSELSALVPSATSKPSTKLRLNPLGLDHTTLSDHFDFYRHYEQTNDLSFIEAKGYWSNTYIPGDTQIRLLQARLKQPDHKDLGQHRSPEQNIRPYLQALDIPNNNALGLQLSADTSAVDGPTRARLQIGIQAIEQRKGQRPSMNLAVVVDLPQHADTQTLISTRALLDALLASRQSGDRFSLLSSHNGGQVLLSADQFRYGALQLAKTSLLESARPNDPAANLLNALNAAGNILAKTNDPSLPAGSRSIVLISANTLKDVNQLQQFVHKQATSGIGLSVFPLGSKTNTQQIEKLVLSGIGNLRVLEKPAQAKQLIEAELYASSQAVARSARLSIRLASHVQLISVIGSKKLHQRDAQRVRDIEQGMDKRLSANLGIAQDRGQDEDGIQIVIPSVHSGDSLVILLDVMINKPGDIADVSLRYKDMVFLKNGSLADQLNLPKGQSQRHTAQLLVLKNLLGHHFKQSASQAADQLSVQRPDRALQILMRFKQTMEQAIEQTPSWRKDQEIQTDLDAVKQYINLLKQPTAGQQQRLLMDSLRYAAWRKSHRTEQESTR